MPFEVTWMDLEIIILNEVSQRKTNITHMCNLKKKIEKNLYIKQKQTHIF